MLNDLSEQIRLCYDRAEDAKQKAEATSDSALKADLLEMERRWLMLARSYAFGESLSDFTKENARRQQQFDGAVLSRSQPDEMLRLQETSTLLIQESKLDSLYQRILDAAVELMSSDMASMQELHPERNELRLLAWRGFHPQSARFWEWVQGDSGSTCAAALSAGGRIIVSNIETSGLIVGSPDADEYRRSGIRACQSTPLVSRSGRLLGMISTHWRIPHQPSERALRSLDVLARQAADLIERSKSEAMLRQSEQRARQLVAIVESSDDAIIGRDLKGTITAWNKGAERIFGHTAEEAVGMPSLALMPPSRHHEESENLDRIRRGERVEPYDTVRLRKDGTSINVSLSISPIRDLSGEVVGASKILRDITDRKRDEERIAILAREAEHRTKNVLAAVQAVVHFSHGKTAEELKRIIEGRLRALSNAHSLVAESRWVGADPLSLAREELAPYLAKETTRARIEGPHIPVTPKQAQAIAVILHELTTNAAKYGALSAANGRVELTLAAVSKHGILLRWTERGGPLTSPPTRRGFGTQVMQTLVKMELDGQVRFDWRAEGLVCEIEIQI